MKFNNGTVFELTEAQDTLITLQLNKRSTALQLEGFINDHSVGLRLFRTSDGHLGKSDSSVKEGDIVILLSGLPLAMVARTAGSKYTLKGPAYIHGIMNGQKWPENETALIDIILK